MMMTLIWKTHAEIKDVYVCVHAMLDFFIGLIYLLTKEENLLVTQNAKIICQ